jgi:hypothetical protein
MSSRQDPKRIEIIRKHLAAMTDELNAHDINVVGIACGIAVDYGDVQGSVCHIHGILSKTAECKSGDPSMDRFIREVGAIMISPGRLVS